MSNYDDYKPQSEWEREVLAYDPFEGDFGDSGDVIFKDRFVVARKQFQCVHCRGTIFPRQVNRYLVARFDGEMRTYRWCSFCCEAMARSWHDDGNEINSRLDLIMETT